MNTTPRRIQAGNAEVRLHANGTVDEVVVRDSAGNCLIHLEQMEAGAFWLRVYSGTEGEDVVVWLRSASEIVATKKNA